MTATVKAIYRHPVKGLRSEGLERAPIQLGRGIPGDRAFAFQFLDESVPAELRAQDAERATWMSKFHLAVQHDWPALARIVPRWDAARRHLRLESEGEAPVEGDVTTCDGRGRLADFVHAFLARSQPYEKAKHATAAPLRLLGHADLTTRYTDSSAGFVSLATAETFADLGSRLGLAVDPRRFRKNLVLAGAPAWSELGWIGRKLRIGSCVLLVQKPLGRCANIDVHPETGARDADIYSRLKPVFGHALTGVRAEVVESGEVALGDSWALLDS